jgi:hypothetical protein
MSRTTHARKPRPANRGKLRPEGSIRDELARLEADARMYRDNRPTLVLELAARANALRWALGLPQKDYAATPGEG